VRKCVSYEPFVLDVGVAVRPRPSVDYLLPSCGSLENLNDRILCGLSLCSRRIRCTVVGEMPDVAAIWCMLKCLVPPGDGSGIVASTRWSPGESVNRPFFCQPADLPVSRGVSRLRVVVSSRAR